MDKNEQIVFVKVYIEQYSKLMLLLKLIYPAVELKFQKCGMAGWRDGGMHTMRCSLCTNN